MCLHEMKVGNGQKEKKHLRLNEGAFLGGGPTRA
jgi:hypothetical protein